MAQKQLACTSAAGQHQKEWFSQLRTDVFEKQQPYAIVQADMPFELFHVMDVPVVSNQWWAAIIFKRKAAPTRSKSASSIRRYPRKACTLWRRSRLDISGVKPFWERRNRKSVSSNRRCMGR